MLSCIDILWLWNDRILVFTLLETLINSKLYKSLSDADTTWDVK